MIELPQQPPRCIHFQSKSMAVYGEGFAGNPNTPGGATDCCCVQTARPLGPDNGWVGMTECCDPDRDCYQEY
jgi:hypothetical protein